MRLTALICQKRGCSNLRPAGFRLCGMKSCAKEKQKEEECDHSNYSDTMTGAVCNDCGKEEE